jgi:hypothetical protein
VALTPWPFRFAFAASRDDFDRLARRIETGYRPAGSTKVGRFVVRRAELRDGRPRPWTDMDPKDRIGFVRNPNTPSNLWSHVRLDGGWAYIAED